MTLASVKTEISSLGAAIVGGIAVCDSASKLSASTVSDDVIVFWLF